LSADGFSFEAAATGEQFLPSLADGCLLILGKNDSEATYLQLSRPIEVAPVDFTLAPAHEVDLAVLESSVKLAIPGSMRLKDSTNAVFDVSASVTAITSAFNLKAIPLVKPTAGLHTACLAVGQHSFLVPLEYRAASDADGVTMRLLVNPIGDKPLFDRLCVAIAKQGNINFEQTFWPYARAEIAKSLPDALEADAKDKRRQTRAISSLQEKLKPDNKAAVPFANYVEAVKGALLSSPSLTSRAEAIVDRNHPQGLPEGNVASDTNGKKIGGQKEKPTFDREAEVAKEINSLFAAWAEGRMLELEKRQWQAAPPNSPTWTDQELNDYATLLLWSRIQHLEKCVHAFRLPEAPTEMTGTARFKLRKLWPASMIPDGFSCQPENLLLKMTP